jgi:hypothetical protein
VITELQDQLLAREKELDNREGAIIVWEESLTTFTCTLGVARVGCDASLAHGSAIRRDHLTQVSASSSQSERRKARRQTMDERAILLGLQETDLGVGETIMTKELECGLRHPDGHDLLVKLDETHARVHKIADDRATEAR